MKEAILYDKRENGAVACRLCAHHCIIKDGETGLCDVRKNRAGVLWSETYEKIVTTHIDPIEKKPLFHYKPGSLSFSVATVGCNFRCTWCQNHDISQWAHEEQSPLPGQAIGPEELARMAANNRCATLAFTYTEPTVFAEIALDTARAAAPLGVDSIFVTNGYMSSELIDTFGPLMKGANVDLKAFNDDTYRQYTGARLQPVCDSIRHLHENGTWVEITTLIIPELNDSEAELTAMASFIADIDPAIPWHISAFHPTYQMTDRKRTPLDTLHAAYTIGKRAGLRFVYTGNAPGDRYESTYCPKCGTVVIERTGFQILFNRIVMQKCPTCNETIEGVY